MGSFYQHQQAKNSATASTTSASKVGKTPAADKKRRRSLVNKYQTAQVKMNLINSHIEK
jgi:hypothetical protein